MSLAFHPEALLEMIEAGRYYEGKASGLGAAFLDSVDAAARRIEAGPRRWPPVGSGLRRCPVRRFPFVLYYDANDAGNLVILAVTHHRRQPSYWEGRRKSLS